VLWLVSFFPAGFPLIQLVQWSAGVVTLASTYELARRLRLPRLLRLGSVFVLLGMANVLVQFTTSQTDLTAAAFANAGLLFVWEALKSRRTPCFLLAGLAFGLAVGTKQTVLVWGPGFAAIGFLWWWSWGRSIKTMLRPAAMAILLALCFCLPLFVETYWRYGNWLVPERFMQYRSLRAGETVQFLFYPFVWLWHLTWPAVQPPLLWYPLEWLHQQSLVVMQQTTVKGEGSGLPRLAGQLKTWFASQRFYEDFSPPSFLVLGIVAAALILLAWEFTRGWTWPFRPVMALTAGCAFFWLCSLEFGWKIYSWRFWVIRSPVFVLAAVSLPVWLWPERKSRYALWIGFWLLLSLPVTFRGLWLHGNNGLLTLLFPDQAANAAHNLAMDESAEILDRIPRRIVVSADRDLRSSFLFRRPIAHHVTYRNRLPTRDYVTPVREVLIESKADTAIISGSPQPDMRAKLLPLSMRRPLWAVRLFKDGELPPGSLEWLDGHHADGWIAPEAVLVLKQWPSSLLHLRVRNFHPKPLRLTVTGGAGQQTFSLPPDIRQDVALRVDTRDVLRFHTDRVFMPQPPDTRQLGLLIEIPPGQEGEAF
jgi:4-amino-4-deoxy-L-arabinose transferase-like glycosyltransferase